MSTTNTDKTVDEQYLALFAEYRELVGKGVRVKEFARWIADNKKLPEPVVDIAVLHARRAKNAIRRKRVRDLCGRQIQPVVAIQIEKMTRGGQKVMDVIYDYLHGMSLDHALTHFEQKDKNIGKQRKASTRNLQMMGACFVQRWRKPPSRVTGYAGIMILRRRRRLGAGGYEAPLREAVGP